MRPIPPRYNPGRPRQGVQQPRPGMSTPFGPRPGINPLNIPTGIYDPSGPRSINFPPELINPVRPGTTGGGKPIDPRLGAPMIPGRSPQMMMRGPQQAPMQQFSYGVEPDIKWVVELWD